MMIARKALLRFVSTLKLPTAQRFGCRTFLSENYKCEEAWKDRTNSALLQKLKSETLYVELAKKFQNEEKISAVDVDLYVNLVHTESHLDELEEIVHKFRRSPNTAFTMPSTPHAVIRAFIDCRQTDSLMRMIDDRLSYGLFPDYYTSNLLMDQFLKQENYRDAVKVAIQMMLQEEYEHPIASHMALYSCYAYLRKPQPEPWNPQPRPKPDEPKEEVKVRVDYIREPYFDDHFDLTNPQHLIGKTLVGLGKHFAKKSSDELVHTSLLLGWTMFEKYDKAISVLDDVLQSPGKQLINKEWFIAIQKLLAQSSGEANEMLDNLRSRLQRLDSEGFLCDGDMLEKIQQLTRAAVTANEQSDIQAQLACFKNWETIRQNEVERQIKEIETRQRLIRLEAKKKELAEKEERLTFFDHLDEWELRYEEKEQLRQEQAKQLAGRSKKMSTKTMRLAEEESYFPPEISKSHRKSE